MGGDEMSRYYEGLRQAQLDTLMQRFQEIDENQGRPVKQAKKAPEPKVTVSTNIGKAGKRPPVKTQARQEDPYGEEDYGSPAKAGGFGGADHGGNGEHTCGFCGESDPNWNEEAIDMHYWKDCQMLTTCWECEQVIEIK